LILEKIAILGQPPISYSSGGKKTMLPEPFVEKIEAIKMQYRVLIFAVTHLLLIGLFIFFIYIPKSDAIKRTENKITKLQQQISKAKKTADDLAKFKKEQEKVEAQFAQALKLLPNKSEIPNFLSSISQLGNESNLDFDLFNPKGEKAQGFYMEIPVSMQVTGNYHDIAIFFDKIGRMERIVNITNVSMKPVKQGSSDLKVNCEAVTYRFKGKADEKANKRNKKRRKK